MTIGELAAATGIAASAIRYYEQMGLLPEAPRKGGQRRYDQSAVRRLELIHAARDAGLSIAVIRGLFSSQEKGEGPVSGRWREIVRARIAELDRSRKLLLELANCHCETIQECERTVAARKRRKPS